jgi:uncharacterized protein (TIGR00730 family)
MNGRMTLSLTEARERLQRTIEEYVTLDAELRALENTNYRVSIFGSARIRPQDPAYHAVFKLAQSLSERGIDVVTGGGPGLMEAANRGVSASKRRRSKSYGLPLDLPSLTEPPNRHLDFKSAHKRFSSRLDEFMRLSHAVVVAPGGIGTLLELMYVWQLLQLDAVEPRPMVLLGREYWQGLIDWVRTMPLDKRLINPEDLECVTIVDTPEEALEVIDRSYALFLAERQRVADDAALVDAEVERLRQAADELADDLARQVQLTETALHGMASEALAPLPERGEAVN